MATERTRRIRGTRPDVGNSLKQAWVASLSVECEPLAFEDLEIGEKFIAMPLPGDNAGHGGLLNACHVFMKVRPYRNKLVGKRNCVRVFCFRREDYGAYVPKETLVIMVN